MEELYEGAKLDAIKGHLKKNWKKYAGAAALVGTAYVGKKSYDKVQSMSNQIGQNASATGVNAHDAAVAGIAAKNADLKASGATDAAVHAYNTAKGAQTTANGAIDGVAYVAGRVAGNEKELEVTRLAKAEVERQAAVKASNARQAQNAADTIVKQKEADKREQLDKAKLVASKAVYKSNQKALAQVVAGKAKAAKAAKVNK